MVHAVLSDPERRRLYDETGEVNEEGDTETAQEGDMWCEYWRTLFPKITEADIDSFSVKYKGSEEETRDVLAAYKKAKGNMCAVMDSIMLATDADEERFRGLIELAMQRKEVPSFAAFRKAAEKKTAGAAKAAAKRKAKADKEAAEAEELMAKIKGRHKERSDATSLSTHRSRQFDSMVSSLEERYGGASARGSARGTSTKQGRAKRTKNSPSPDDLDDAEFERIQKKLTEKRAKR
ncbi:unnamed protein product [Sphacelaria rigidula]